MSWLLSLARSGGTAGSQGGHETRRHRVRGPFPMGACLLLAGTLALAGCGSSSNSTVAITQQPTQQPSNQPPPQTGGGSGEGEGDGGQGAGGGTPPTGTTTTEDGDGDTDSGDTTSTGDGDGDGQDGGSPGGGQGVSGGQTVTQQPQQPPQQPSNQPPPQTGGGSGGQGAGGQGAGGGTPPTITQQPQQPVVSSLSRSGGIPEPKPIKNCTNAQYIQVKCAPYINKEADFPGIFYRVANAWFADNVFANSFGGTDRELIADIIGRAVNTAFNPEDANYNFAYNKVSRKNTEVTYTKSDGFIGLYSYKGGAGEITEDVTLKVAFKNIGHKSYRIQGYIGDSNGITMEGTNFGQIKFSAYGLPEDGQFIDKGIRFSNILISTETGFNELKGSFKNDGSSTSFPTQVVGELKMKRFFDTSPIRNNKPLEYNDNLFKRGDNALAGVFVADKTNEEVTLYDPARVHDEGKLSMLYYGIWANENFTDNRIVFLAQTTKFNPGRTASDYTSHTYHETTSGIVEVRYQREDGFKGVYIYEGETGELTGDVDLYVNFGANSVITTQGDILTDLEIGGYDLKGIIMRNGRIATSGTDNTHNTGVGGIDIDADGIDDSNTAAKISFGDFLAIENSVDRATVSHEGHTRKVRVALSPDGIQAQGSTPETHPSQIAGELEINGFKIKASDGDNNTIVGVFVADKQE